MKFGVREICDVVFKAKAPTKIGSMEFIFNETKAFLLKGFCI